MYVTKDMTRDIYFEHRITDKDFENIQAQARFIKSK